MKSKTFDVLTVVCVVAFVALFYYLWTHPPDAKLKPAPKVEPVEQKRQFIFVSGARCPACDQMERKTLSHAKVSAYLEKHFTVSKTSGRDADKRYGVQQYPTYLILSHDGKEIRRGTGFREPEEFLAWLEARNE